MTWPPLVYTSRPECADESSIASHQSEASTPGRRVSVLFVNARKDNHRWILADPWEHERVLPCRQCNR